MIYKTKWYLKCLSVPCMLYSHILTRRRWLSNYSAHIWWIIILWLAYAHKSVGKKLNFEKIHYNMIFTSRIILCRYAYVIHVVYMECTYYLLPTNDIYGTHKIVNEFFSDSDCEYYFIHIESNRIFVFKLPTPHCLWLLMVIARKRVYISSNN